MNISMGSFKSNGGGADNKSQFSRSIIEAALSHIGDFSSRAAGGNFPVQLSSPNKSVVRRAVPGGGNISMTSNT